MPEPRAPRSPLPLPLAALALALALAACGSTHRAASGVGQPSGRTSSTPAASPTSGSASTPGPPSTGASSTTTAPPTTTTLPREQAGWKVIDETHTAIVSDLRSVSLPDGHTVTLIRFHAGTYRADLHLGSEDPPSGGLNIPAVAGDAVSAAERPHLIATFNGGFKAATNSGGFEVDGQVVVPLVTGDASLVIDAAGRAQVGVWGQGLPLPGEHVVSVRQNLVPLIEHGQVSSQIDNIAAWGAVLNGVQDTARSAVGTDPAGNLVYAASMTAYPADLATALREAGVTSAMELDINPYWIQGDVAFRQGGPLTAAIPGQQQPATNYLSGWTRDFVAILRS